MEFLQNILDNSQLPIISALILGLMTAISPCILATNIAAIAYISKDVKDKKQVFINGLLYTVGRIITYTVIGLIFYFGVSQFSVSGFILKFGEKFLGILLIIIGVFISGIIKFKIPFLSDLTSKVNNKKYIKFWELILLGIVFALAFCPYSGILYFGMLIPMTITSISGLYLPIIFAIATALPIIIVSYFLAYSISSVGSFYNKMKTFEIWFRYIISIIFISVGIYYSTIFFL
ncbi:MAG: cytochrome C biogenesis protein [Bacteroidetes bacterium 4572_128]|nr:MAG: cytochrome C biogenesis protein [Bacteroidetes bacterium 4572_128]